MATNSIAPIWVFSEAGEGRILALANEIIYAEKQTDGRVAVDMYGAQEGRTAAETVGRVYLSGREAETFAAAAGDRMGRLWYPY